MPNDMMIAALNSQRQGKMDAAPSPTSTPEEKTIGIEERLEALESKYDELCKLVGMDDKKESPKEAPRGY